MRVSKINSRAKGKAGELEVVHILREELGIEACRNLDQWRDGGCDILGIEGWAIEVKRAKTAKFADWWDQAVRQAGISKIPALWYRLDRKQWKVIIPLHAINKDFGFHLSLEWTAEITPEVFCALVREDISEREEWNSRHQKQVGQPH